MPRAKESTNIGLMKSNTKAKILSAGARVIHLKGYHNTGILELVTAAGIPKGSFYFYFKSKEEFGLELLDYYTKAICAMVDELSKDNSISPLSRLRRFFEWSFASLEGNDFKGGCPIGNLSQEMADVNENFREKLKDAFDAIKKGVAIQLKEAQERKEIFDSLDVPELTEFIVSSWQGALLQMKVTRSTAPGKAFEQMVFERILKGVNPSNL